MNRLLWLAPLAILVACSGSQTKSEGKTEAQKAMAAVAPKKEEAAKKADEKTQVAKSDVAKAEASAEAKVEGTADGAGAKTTCTHGKDVRTLAIEPKDKGCELKYTKAGETKSVGNGISGTAHCEKIAAKMKATLEKSGFKCE